MSTHTVLWAIDVDAKSVVQAATAARRMQSPGTTATVFHVYPAGTSPSLTGGVVVDLDKRNVFADAFMAPWWSPVDGERRQPVVGLAKPCPEHGIRVAIRRRDGTVGTWYVPPNSAVNGRAFMDDVFRKEWGQELEPPVGLPEAVTEADLPLPPGDGAAPPASQGLSMAQALVEVARYLGTPGRVPDPPGQPLLEERLLHDVTMSVVDQEHRSALCSLLLRVARGEAVDAVLADLGLLDG